MIAMDNYEADLGPPFSAADAADVDRDLHRWHDDGGSDPTADDDATRENHSANRTGSH